MQYSTGAFTDCLATLGTHAIAPKAFERVTRCMRAAGALPETKRGRGATQYDSASAISATLGCLLGPSDTKAAATVTAIRSLELTGTYVNPLSNEPGTTFEDTARSAFDHLRPIVADSTKLLTAGSALDAIVEAMRLGLVPDPRRVVIEFYDRDRMVNIYLDGHPTEQSVCLTYGTPRPFDALQNIFRINGRALQRIADALGPMTIPPPY